jgi:pimeloyl-ACP methyl ester carboxylesterase
MPARPAALAARRPPDDRRPFVTGRTLPPLRSTKVWPARGGLWCYDQWGRHGRPLILIPAVLFGRTTWWPAAADLRPHATVVAVDLPGHGGSDHRSRYDPDELIDDLAELVAHLGLRQAPVVVAHGGSAGLAVRFAHRYAVHAVVTVDPYLPERADPARYLRDMRTDSVPPHLRDLASPVGEPELLAAYRRSMASSPIAADRPAARPARLAVHSRSPAPRVTAALPGWRHEVYGVPGRFAQLSALDCVVRDVRALL